MFALGSSMAGQRFDSNNQSEATKERLRIKRKEESHAKE
jgi:hypothetical protein